MDYSHPRNYILIGLIPTLLGIALGLKMERGFYFAVLGVALFPFVYYYLKPQYDRTERQIFVELIMGVLGFAFLPIGYAVGIYGSLIPTGLDIIFFISGFASIMASTNFLYMLEPDTNREVISTIILAIIVQTILMLVIGVMTAGYYMG